MSTVPPKKKSDEKQGVADDWVGRSRIKSRGSWKRRHVLSYLLPASVDAPQRLVAYWCMLLVQLIHAQLGKKVSHARPPSQNPSWKVEWLQPRRTI